MAGTKWSEGRGALLERVGAVVLIVVAGSFLAFLLNRSAPPNVGFMGAVLDVLLPAAGLTFLLTAGAYAAGMGLGLALGWARTTRRRVARGVAAVWTESIRGTPLFVQLLFLFSVLSFYNPGGLALPHRVLLTGFLALFVNTSAYQAEIFRAGLQSVGAGQIEAAKSVGLGYWGTMRSVALPQAVRVVIPPLTNEFVLLLKGSSLLFFIGVQELTYEGRLLSFTSGSFVEVYTVMTGLYLLMTVPLAKGVAWLERRYRIPGLGFEDRPAAGPRRRRATAARVLGVRGDPRPQPRSALRAVV